MKPYYQDESITLYHGDCREVLAGMPDASVDFVLTDPPYGVDWQSNRRIVKHERIANDGNLTWLDDVFAEVGRVLANDRLCLSFYGWPDADVFVSTWKRHGLLPKSHLVWIKNNIGLGWFSRGQHEVAYLLAKGSPVKPQVALSDVQQADTTGNLLHPTQKPVPLMANWIAVYSQLGDTILDPFAGSGTTLVAAKELGRRAIGIELEEKYCEIAASRLAQGVLGLEFAE